MKIFFKLTILLLTLLSSASAAAYDFEVDGIYYDINGNEATVTYKGISYYEYHNEYSGDVIIPETVTYGTQTYAVTAIGYGAFACCSELTSITIPNSVTEIGSRAFYGCSELKDAIISNSVIKIFKEAFSGCTRMTSAPISESVTTIGENAFKNCRGLTSVTIPKSVTEIGDAAFSGCSNLSYISVANDNPIYDSRNNCNAIICKASFSLITGCKNTIIPNTIRHIGSSAFEGCSQLTSATIPNTVWTIGKYAFQECTGLTSITIPNSVTTIKQKAFNGCSSLNSITIPNSITSIEESAFYGCSGPSSITIPQTVTSIGNYAFFGCTGLIKMDIPNSVDSICEKAFMNCSSLTSVTIPKSVVFIGNNAFSGCTALDTLNYNALFAHFATISSNVDNLPFSNLNISTINIGDNVGSLPGGFAYGLKELTSISIPESIRVIGFSAFSNCTGLSRVNISNLAAWCSINFYNLESNPLYYAHHLYCEGIKVTNLTIPDSVTAISRAAFAGSSISNAIIPNSVKYINEYAFYSCTELTDITIPESIIEIKENVFGHCNSITSIISLKPTPPTIAANTFSVDAITYATVYVPIGTKNYYQNAEHWKEFFNIVELDPESVLASSISLDKTSAELTEGNTLQLTATVLPTNASNRTVTWKSSNTSVATVSSSGLVAAKSPGSATITATTTDGTNLSANCYVTVESGSSESTIISFVDPRVKALCVQNWDTNGDGELSKAEAATVTNLGTVFKNNSTITSFDELQYFTGLTSIGEYAFYCCWYLTSITIPSSVTSIGYDAFSSCSRLTGITIPSSVVSISNYAFDYCSGLTNITIPSSVTSIGAYAFRSCSGLASIKVDSNNPKYDSRSNCNAIIHTSSNQLIVGCKNTVFLNSVTSIGDGAFYGCTGLTNLTIPSSITYIGSAAFNRCSGLANVKVESGNSQYDSRNNCNAIIYTSSNRLVVGCKNTIIPNSVTTIGDYAFNGCNGLTNLTIPNSVTSIGSYVFDDCSGLTSITIPKSVTSIGIRVFEGCSGLTSMKVESGNSKYDSRNNCNAIIETNSNKLINGCKNTTIPNTVTSIGEDAFTGCNSLTSISIPASIISICDYAFHNCTGLSKITCFATTPPVIYSHTFPSSVTNRAYLYVLAESLNAYQSASYWNNFIYIQEIPVLATSISLNKTSATLYMGNTLQLIATVLPSATTDKTVSWSSNNTSVATVSSNGLVTPKSTGSATITVRTEDGSNLTAQCIVTVKQYATSISLSETNVTICTGNTLQLAATVMPSTTSNPSVTWTSSNTSVATVSSTGLVTAKSTGNAVITAKTSDGSNLSATCSVTVKQLATSISLNETSATLFTGNTLQLSATVLPSTTSNPSVTWTSSNTSVATVSSTGLVTAKSTGNATITARTTDGSNLSATCVITVKAYVTSLTLDQSAVTILEGDTITLTPTILPTYATNQNLNWSSNNTGVATVNNGVVIGRSGGETTITARTVDGSNLSATCKVTVIPNFDISMPNFSHIRGSANNTFDLTVDLANRYDITGMQFDIQFPEGVTIAKDNNGEYDIWPDDSRKTRNHTTTASLIGNNSYRILVSSATANSLKGHSGTVVHIMIEIPLYHVSGNKQIKYSNIILSEPDETRHTLPTKYSMISYYYKEGDANADVNVDVADYVITGNYILQNSPENFWYDAANVDHNSTIDVNDLTGITNIALGRREGGILQMPAIQQTNEEDVELTANPLDIRQGQTKALELCLNETFAFAGFQMDLQLPEGLRLVDASLVDGGSGLSLATAELADGSIRLLASSFSLKDLAVNNSSFLRLTLAADDEIEADGKIMLYDIKFSKRDLTLHTIDHYEIPVENGVSSLEHVYSVVHIYADGLNIIIDSPESGTAQVVTIAGITQVHDISSGHNIIPMESAGVYIVTLNGTTAKLYLK